MSEYVPKCPVCGEPVKHWYDRQEGTTLEASAGCLHCGLWSYQFAYGNTQERIGVVEFAWSWTEPQLEEYGRRLAMSAATLESRRLYRHPDYPCWRGGWCDGREPVFADWLADNGFPLSESAIRAVLADSAAPPAAGT